MQAINGNNGQRLAKRLRFAEPYFFRLLKFTIHDHWQPGEALLIRRTRWLYLFLQHKPVDVIYLNESDVVIGLQLNTKPYKLFRHVKRAASILEVPAGTVTRTGTRVGHEIRYYIR